MTALPVDDDAVVVTFRVGPTNGTPNDHMSAAVATILMLTQNSLGRSAIDAIVIDRVWLEPTLKHHTHCNDRVHVALSMPEDLRVSWHGLAAKVGKRRDDLYIESIDDAPKDATHWRWMRAAIDPVRRRHIQAIDDALGIDADPSGGFLASAFVLLVLSCVAFATGHLAHSALSLAATFGMAFCGAVRPSRDGTPTMMDALHERRNRLAVLVGVSTVMGAGLSTLVASSPSLKGSPMMIGLLPIIMVATVAITVSVGVRNRILNMRRDLTEIGRRLLPTRDETRRAKRSTESLLAICSVLPEEQRDAAAIAAERCRIAATYSVEGPLMDGFARSMDALDDVVASHRRASTYAGQADAVPLARRVQEALVAAGDEAETLRVALLANETDSLDTLGRYLETRRSSGALSPVA
jgi:hypothetical protein